MSIIKKKQFIIAAVCILVFAAGLILFFAAGQRRLRESFRETAILPVSVDLSKTIGDDGFLVSRYATFEPVAAGDTTSLEFDVYFEGGVESMQGSSGMIMVGRGDGGAYSWNPADLYWKEGEWTRMTLPLSTAVKSGDVTAIDYIAMTIEGMPEVDAVIRMTNVRIVSQETVVSEEEPVGGEMRLSNANTHSIWKIVPHNDKYPTDDMIVARNLADHVNINRYNGVSAKDDITLILNQQMGEISQKRQNGGNNTTTGFGNTASNYTGTMYGGTLYVPEGRYRVGWGNRSNNQNDQLIIPYGVTLTGDWRAPTEDDMAVSGTVFETNYGRGLQPDYSNNSNLNAFIVMLPNSMIRNLSIWYPEQDPENIVPYRTTVHMFRGGNWGADYVHVRNMTFVNSYHAIMQGPGGNGCPNIHNIYGTPLSGGIRVDSIGDIGRFDYMHFAPEYWEQSGLPNAPTATRAKNNVRSFLYNNAVAFHLRRIDWSYLCFSSAKGYNIGLNYTMQHSAEGEGMPNGQVYSLKLEDCMTGINIEHMSQGAGNLLAEIDIRNCYNGVVTQVNGNHGSASFNTTTIDAINHAVLNEGVHRLHFTQSKIERGKIVSSGALSFIDSDLDNDAPHITLNPGGLGANLVGNRVKGQYVEPEVEKFDFMPLEISTDPIESKRPDILKAEDAFVRQAKPAKADLYVFEGNLNGFNVTKDAHTLFNLTNLTFPTTNQGNTRTYTDSAFYTVPSQATINQRDITDALQAMLNQAAAGGGGVVYIPPGHYVVRGDKPIVVPPGVELKGSVDIGRNPVQVGTILNIYGGTPVTNITRANGYSEAYTEYIDPNNSATIILSENSGIRGIVFAYPANYTSTRTATWTSANRYEMTDMVLNSLNRYPYAIQGRGANVYAVNISLHNAFNGIDLKTYKCDNHYVQYLSGVAFNKFIQVGGGSEGGMINNFQMNVASAHNGGETKNGAWTSPYAPDQRPRGNTGVFRSEIVSIYTHVNLIAFEIGYVKDQIIYNNFNWSGNIGIYFVKEANHPEPSTGNSVGNAYDSAVHSMVFETWVDMDFINNQIVSLREGTATSDGGERFNILRPQYRLNRNSFLYLTSGVPQDKTINFYNNAFWGSGGDSFIKVAGGTAKMYNSHLADNLGGRTTTSTLVNADTAQGNIELYGGFINPTVPIVNLTPENGGGNAPNYLLNRVSIRGFYHNENLPTNTNRITFTNNRTFAGYSAPPSSDSSPQKFLGSIVNNIYNPIIAYTIGSDLTIGSGNNARTGPGRNGVFVESIDPTSFAARIPSSGSNGGPLRQDDVITRVNGISFANTDQFVQIIDEIPDGEQVVLRVWRRRLNDQNSYNYVRIRYTKGPENDAFGTAAIFRTEDCESFMSPNGQNGQIRMNNSVDTQGGRYMFGNLVGSPWAHYKMYFTEVPTQARVRYAHNGTNSSISFRLGSPNGPLLFTAATLPRTGDDFNNITTNNCNLTGGEVALPLNEVIDVYVMFGANFNFQWLSFTGTDRMTDAPIYGSNDPAESQVAVSTLPTVTGGSFSPATLSRSGGNVTMSITGTNLHRYGDRITVDVAAFGGGTTVGLTPGSLTIDPQGTSATFAGTTLPQNNSGKNAYYTFIVKIDQTILRTVVFEVPS
ncbi:MAG: PDZ domain-containing protein [Oscillospiraceae bacterium]|nr:PDZ domain-containing protein [Oscillospiraceae bacterium]